MRDLKLSFADAYETETSWIVADTLCNACFEIDKATGKTEYLFSFKGEKLLQDGLYYRIYSYGRELIFAPGYAKQICIWNMDTKEQTCHSIIGERDLGYRYVDSYRIGDILWLFPSSLDQPIVTFDIKRRKTEYWNDYMTHIPEEVKDRGHPVFFRQYAKREKQAYTVLKNSPYLVRFDLEKRDASIKKIGDYLFTDVGCDETAFWFSLLQSDSVIRWEPDSGFLEKFDSHEPDSGMGYSNIIENQGRILLIPNLDNKIMEPDLLTKDLKVFCSLPEGLGKMKDVRNGWRRFFSYRNMEDVVRLCPNQADCMVDIEVNKRQAHGRFYDVEEVWWREVFHKQAIIPCFAEEMAETEGEIMENSLADLETYLDYIKQMESRQPKICENSYGKRIHQALNCNS
ncbi:MAG: hypothetical protein HFI30_12390 [Lachnospiraceae bacterium]|jgi:hypothetical protein|nr:hypothetical protein [Lachnospiraceae bacterium]